MKSPAIFREYIWLVNTIFKAERITLERLNQKWMDTDMSGGLPMARSTFNRHKDAIEDMFGIIIDCDHMDGYKYYISNAEVLKEESVQNWMLSTLTVNNIILEALSLHNRIQLESIPSEGENLRKVIDAMKRNMLVSAVYKKYNSSDAKEYMIEPYCIKLYCRRWYLIGPKQESGEIRTLSLDRIVHLTVTDIGFKMDEDFDADQYFKDCYGIVSGDGTTIQRVVLRAFGTERLYLRDLPIHHSQKEIASGADWSDFEYILRPTLDFSGYLVSRSNLIKVIKPAWLVEKIRKMHEDSLRLYEKPE